jgi:hypothetical protein
MTVDHVLRLTTLWAALRILEETGMSSLRGILPSHLAVAQAQEALVTREAIGRTCLGINNRTGPNSKVGKVMRRQWAIKGHRTMDHPRATLMQAGWSKHKRSSNCWPL